MVPFPSSQNLHKCLFVGRGRVWTFRNIECFRFRMGAVAYFPDLAIADVEQRFLLSSVRAGSESSRTSNVFYFGWA